MCINIEDQEKCDKNNLRCRTWVLKEKVREIWGLKQADSVIFNKKKIKLKEYLWASQWECTKKFKTHTLPLWGLMEWPGFHYTVTDQFFKNFPGALSERKCMLGCGRYFEWSSEPHRVPCNYPLGNEEFPSLEVDRAELRESGLNDLNCVIPFHLKKGGKF